MHAMLELRVLADSELLGVARRGFAGRSRSAVKAFALSGEPRLEAGARREGWVSSWQSRAGCKPGPA
jgi:hypothetical protein